MTDPGMTTQLVPARSIDIDSAIASSFDAHGRRGWLHTEVDLWLWDGVGRDASRAAELIDRNRREFERYGELSRIVREKSGRRGRPALAYMLNFGQALLYCTLSDAPRAADVREGLIRTFTKYATGELAPTTSDAVVQSMVWDRMTEAIAGLAVTVDRGFQSIGREIGDLRDHVSATNTRIDALATRVGNIEARTRREPKTGDLALLAAVAASDYGRKCPCCEKVQIVEEDGAKTQEWTVDHTNGPWDNRIEHLWCVCRSCNQRLWAVVGFRAEVRAEFAVFQKRLARRRPEQLRLVM